MLPHPTRTRACCLASCVLRDLSACRLTRWGPDVCQQTSDSKLLRWNAIILAKPRNPLNHLFSKPLLILCVLPRSCRMRAASEDACPHRATARPPRRQSDDEAACSRPATCAAQEWRPRLSTAGLLTGSEGSLSALALMRAASAMRAASLLSLLPKRCTDEEERQALKQKFLERICFVDLALIENRLLGELQITKSGWEAGCFSWTFP